MGEKRWYSLMVIVKMGGDAAGTQMFLEVYIMPL
jgi:hypothetical protein